MTAKLSLQPLTLLRCRLFETVYKLASSPELPKPKDDDNTDGIVFKADPKASLNTSSPPDLIMFGTLWFGDQWRDSQVLSTPLPFSAPSFLPFCAPAAGSCDGCMA